MKIMSSVALSPKFQIVIPKDVRNLFNLSPGQQMQVRAVGGKIEVTPELPMSAARGMFPGIDSNVPNDPESPTWPGGCDALAEPFWVPISERK
jgi:AbrB family looped-hinge helix DNA binding protein